MDFNKIKNKNLSFVYITSKQCNVCKILKPKLKKLSEEYYPNSFFKISINETPEVSGFFMAFTVPTLIIYSQGREIARYSRNLSIDIVRNKLNRFQKLQGE